MSIENIDKSAYIDTSDTDDEILDVYNSDGEKTGVCTRGRKPQKRILSQSSPLLV